VHPIPPRYVPSAEQPVPLRQFLARAAVVVAVLGVLPFVLDAPGAWQFIGTSVSVALVARSMQLIWRAVFSTDPRYLVQG
jgi:hypothetical protein